jgi:hypothetical protein
MYLRALNQRIRVLFILKGLVKHIHTRTHTERAEKFMLATQYESVTLCERMSVWHTVPRLFPAHPFDIRPHWVLLLAMASIVSDTSRIRAGIQGLLLCTKSILKEHDDFSLFERQIVEVQALYKLLHTSKCTELKIRFWLSEEESN